jgi:hypothetical protein
MMTYSTTRGGLASGGARLGLVLALVVLCWSAGSTARAGTIYASGQFLIENDPGNHDDVRENRIFAIDTATGVATPVSPLFTGSTPPALAGTSNGALLGVRSGRLGTVDISAGTFNPYGPTIPQVATAFDIMSDGRGFILPFNSDNETQQLHQIDLATAALTPIGAAFAIGDAIDTAAGQAPGTAEPFVIGLGSVGAVLYGVDLDTYSLIALNPNTGLAAVVGAVGAVGAANGGGYTGFSAMTGVDENGDGVFDVLYGSVNFAPGTGARIGGLARFDLNSGAWSLVGTNPGLIYFGFASFATPVPEPSSIALASTGIVGLALAAWRRRRSTVEAKKTD